MQENSKLVYSTDGGRVHDEKPEQTWQTWSDGCLRVKRETKGRKGKGVITIAGFPQGTDLKKIAALLKKKCGTGGAVKEGIIEIQGDKRDIIKQELEKNGFKVKFAGG